MIIDRAIFPWREPGQNRLALGPFTVGLVSDWTDDLRLGLVAALCANLAATASLLSAATFLEDEEQTLRHRAQAAGETGLLRWTQSLLHAMISRTGGSMTESHPDRGEFYRADEMTKMKLGENIVIERVAGDTVAMTRITISKGGKSPYHVHEDEQLLLLIEGRLQIRDGEIGDAAIHEMIPGDCFRAPSNVRHQVIALEDSVFIEAFGPGPMLTSPIGELSE